jgi:hypothetical protein
MQTRSLPCFLTFWLEDSFFITLTLSNTSPEVKLIVLFTYSFRITFHRHDSDPAQFTLSAI